MIWPYVIGLGSHYGDDQAGWLTLDSLQARGYPAGRMMRARHPAEILDTLAAEHSLIICDACRSESSPGTIRRFVWPAEIINYQRATGSHDLSLIDVLELGCQLSSKSPKVTVWAIEGNSASDGLDASPEIQSSAEQVADAIWSSFDHA